MNFKLKIITISAVLLAVCSSGAMAGGSKNNDFRPFIEHLEFLGYNIKFSAKSAYAQHPKWLNTTVRQYKGGFAFTSGRYSCEPEASKAPVEFLELVNDLNTIFTVAKAITDGYDKYCLVMAAWYPGAYDRNRFARFLESWNDDTKVKFYKDRETLLRFVK